MRIFACICLLMSIHIFDAKLPESKLCTINRNETLLTCSNQLWGAESLTDECILWLPASNNTPKRNSAECDAMSFQDDGAYSVQPGLVQAKLAVYKYISEISSFPIVALNVTFSNSKWRDLQMRFQPSTKRNDGFTNFCRKFKINTNKTIPLKSQLFYDCLFENNISGRSYNFEYYATDYSSVSFGKYLFKTSEHMNFGRELFMYMDFSKMPLLTLRLQTIYEGYSFEPQEYNVVLQYAKHQKEVINYTLIPTLRGESEWTYEFDTHFRSGNYSFVAHRSQGEYYISRTPIYTIADNPHERILVITIVGCGCMLLSLFTFIFFIWRQREALLKDSKQPRVLMIYSPTTVNHISVVIQLANYLKEFCHINALSYHIEVPKTPSKDPFKWINDAFKDSNFVMVLSSPCRHCNRYEGIYRNVDTIGLRLIAENLGNRNSKHIFSVILPYCEEMNMPAEVQNLPCFNLLKDFRKILGYIHTSSTSLYTQYIVEPLVYGVKSKFGPEGAHLLRAMDEARLDLARHDCVCIENSTLIELNQLDVHVDVETNKGYLEEEKWPASAGLPSSAAVQHFTEEMYPPLKELNLQGTEDSTLDSLNMRKPVSLNNDSEVFDVRSLLS